MSYAKITNKLDTTSILQQLESQLTIIHRISGESLPIVELLEQLITTDNGLLSGLLMDDGNYAIIENGQSRIANYREVAEIRKVWRGHFLLDVPSRILTLRIRKRPQEIKLGRGGWHKGLERILIRGMSKPGVAFGYKAFKKDVLGKRGLGHTSALTRYINILRVKFGDTGDKSRCIHSVSVDESQSGTRNGYMFDSQYDYLVIMRQT